MKNLGIDKYNTVITPQVTDGQASTAMLANQYIKDDESIVIYNIDTGIKENVITRQSFSHDGTITTAIASGDH
jgi:hypothetical protein